MFLSFPYINSEIDLRKLDKNVCVPGLWCYDYKCEERKFVDFDHHYKILIY